MKMNRLRQDPIWEWQAARLLTILLSVLCIIAAYKVGYMRGWSDCEAEATAIMKSTTKDYDELIRGYEETINGYKRLVDECQQTINHLQQQLTMCQNELARVTMEYQQTLAQIGR
jgi:Tfp pilus assembly protein PilO